MFEALKELVFTLGASAGFEKVAIELDLNDEERVPFAYLESSYASILIWPISQLSPEKLIEHAVLAERILDEILTARESSGVVIDGYVIIALDKYYENLKSVVLEIEQSTRLCRKHIVWFDASGWARLERVTTLGVSKVTKLSDIGSLPTLDHEAQMLMDELESTQPRALARAHDTWSAQ